MNRRRVLQGLAALPLAGTLAGCKEQPAKGTLKIVLHGPFAVIVVRNGSEYRINAFVPSVPADAKFKHELRFRTPAGPAVSEGQGKRFKYELGAKGLEISNDRRPYFDHGFDDFNLGNIGEFKPEPEKYFVFLDLPVPEVITYIPPAEGVLLKSGRTATLPIEHVLEYRMRDSSDVRLGDQAPMSCSDLVNEFQTHWHSKEHRDQASPSQRPYMEKDFGRCSNSDVAAYFVGVGLPDKTSDPDLEAHAISFFNDVLLKSFPRTPRVENLQLARILGYGPPCDSPPGAKNLPSLSPAVYRDWMPEPRLQLVSAAEDCKLGGVSGCTTGC